MFTSYVKVWGTIVRFRYNYEPADWLIGPQIPPSPWKSYSLVNYTITSPKKSLYPEHLLNYFQSKVLPFDNIVSSSVLRNPISAKDDQLKPKLLKEGGQKRNIKEKDTPTTPNYDTNTYQVTKRFPVGRVSVHKDQTVVHGKMTFFICSAFLI